MKAADLLFKKLSLEGLFDIDRKRILPQLPTKIGLITAADSAAAADFVKIMNERWGGVEINLADVYVQGEMAPIQLVEAIEHFNSSSDMPEILIITRGGGSAEDLAAFNDERVVRAVAASRIPTLVAIGHEVDVSLAELAADQRASTPSNAAQLLVPDKKHELTTLKNTRSSLAQALQMLARSQRQDLQSQRSTLNAIIENMFTKETNRLQANRRLVKIFDPQAALRRGYALVSAQGKFIKSVRSVKVGNQLNVKLADGTMESTIDRIFTDGK
jgi:exodeoxyribonuclease VII large subunit